MTPEDRQYLIACVKRERFQRLGELDSAREQRETYGQLFADAARRCNEQEAAVRRADATLEQLEAQK